jgi:hypothetical protein
MITNKTQKQKMLRQKWLWECTGTVTGLSLSSASLSFKLSLARKRAILHCVRKTTLACSRWISARLTWRGSGFFFAGICLINRTGKGYGCITMYNKTAYFKSGEQNFGRLRTSVQQADFKPHHPPTGFRGINPARVWVINPTARFKPG